MAPASVGNVGVGFDLLGHSVAGAGDRAQVRRIDAPVVRIVGIHGCVTNLPTDPRQNTAGVALLSMRTALGLAHGFELTLHKGIALGSGMGGSAASCVAAVVAANALLEQPLRPEALYPFALDGEAVSLSALVGAIEAARSGVTLLVDHHSSPSCVAGSLVRTGSKRAVARPDSRRETSSARSISSPGSCPR